VVEHILRGQISSVARATVVCAVGEGTPVCLGHGVGKKGNAFARFPV
jgi:hypothetical protein